MTLAGGIPAIRFAAVIGQRIAVGVAIALLALTASGTGAGAASSSRYVVVYRDDVDPREKTARLERAHGFVPEFRYAVALKGFAAALTPAQAGALAADPDVAYVSQDGTLQAVGVTPLVAGETVTTGVRRIGAATDTTAHEASTVAVAVIDTGIDFSFAAPELNELNVSEGINCVTGGSAQDDNGHGTLVSGVIGAKNAGSGIVGVAPGTQLYAVKVLDALGSGTTAQVICGIEWVAANAAAKGIGVANMSLGGSGSNDGNCGLRNKDPLHQAVCGLVTAGVTVVAAAGNSGANFARFVPASYPEALTVTAMGDCDGAPGGSGSTFECTLLFPLLGEQDDRYASFSNFAMKSAEVAHTIAAPGVWITSTWFAGFYLPVSGTSIATPHVTAAVALCYGSGATPGPCAGMAPAQVVAKLRSDAAARAAAAPGYGFVGDPDQPVRNRYYGYLVWAGGY